MNSKQAIEYLDSIMSNYNTPVYCDKDNPQYRLCQIWLSNKDMIALKMAQEALKERDRKCLKLREPTPDEIKMIDEYIRSISVSTGVNFYSYIRGNNEC